MFILYWIDPVTYSVNRTGTEVELVVHTPQTLGSPIGFFNPVIPTQNFVQARTPEGCFWQPTSRANFQSRISPRLCFRIPNPQPEIREIQDPEKPIDDPQASCRSCWPRGFGSLIPNLHSWKFTSVQVGSSPPFYFSLPPRSDCSPCTIKCGTEPIRYVTLLFPNRRGAASRLLQISRRNHRSYKLCINRRSIWYD